MSAPDSAPLGSAPLGSARARSTPPDSPSPDAAATGAGGHGSTGPEAVPAGVPLVARYDAVLVDLDGVVYRADQVVPGASRALEHVRMLGIPVLFLTNNSSRTPSEVAEKLTRLGVRATAADVLTSAMATAAMLRSEHVASGVPS